MARLRNEVARRTVADLEELLRSGIASGEHAPGQLLPSARELSRRHGIGPRSVRNALRALEDEHLIVAEPRRGYRVLNGAGAARKCAALAFVVPRFGSAEIRSAYAGLLNELQRVAGAGGSPLLALGGKGVGAGEISEQLSVHEVRGAIVNSYDPDLIKAIRRLEVPLVAVDVWHRDLAVDSVIQDGFGGGYLAAEYLLGRGHERIAYFGRRVPRELGMLAADRLGGALSGAVEHGGSIPPGMQALTTEDSAEERRQAIERLLRGENRPTGIIALWAEHAETSRRVAADLGLEIGRDVEIVGWQTRAAPASETGSPRIVWSMAEMAEVAVARLEGRRANPGMPVTVSKIPVQLELS